jgi:hypothetical protein
MIVRNEQEVIPPVVGALIVEVEVIVVNKGNVEK